MQIYRPAFIEKLPAIEASIEAMPGNLAEVVPGLTKKRLVRFFRRFSVLLGRLDKSGAKHPQYLWNDGVLAPASLLPQVDAAIGNMGDIVLVWTIIHRRGCTGLSVHQWPGK